jgi:hypothetical protein
MKARRNLRALLNSDALRTAAKHWLICSIGVKTSGDGVLAPSSSTSGGPSHATQASLGLCSVVVPVVVHGAAERAFVADPAIEKKLACFPSLTGKMSDGACSFAATSWMPTASAASVTSINETGS